MNAVELLKIARETLKVMSDSGLKLEDYAYVGMYEEYREMRRRNDKYRYAIAFLSEKYNVSESKAKRIIRRFESSLKLDL